MTINMEKKKRRFFFSVFVQDIIAIPLARKLIKMKANPNVITVIGLISSFIAGLLYLEKYFQIGALFFLFALIIDSTDGRVARGQNITSELGEKLDAISDKTRSVFVMICLVYSAFGFSLQSVLLVLLYMILPLVRPHIRKKLSLNADPTEYFWYSTKLNNWLKQRSLCGLYNGWERSVLALFIGPLLNLPILIIPAIIIEIAIYISGLFYIKRVEL